MECPEHASCPEALPLREIRKQQRRLAALLQRHDLDVFVPEMKRRPLARKIHVCVCSRLDPEGNYHNTADEFLKRGFRKPRKSSKAHLPDLDGLRTKSRSLETLIGVGEQSADPDDKASGSWTERDLHAIHVPRMDPLGQRYSQRTDVIRPKDIENFSYANLRKQDELVLPPIPKRATPDVDQFGGRQLSVTMLVPDNTPVSTANNERSTRGQDAGSRGVNKGGGRPRNERSLSNFVNQFGEIKEEGVDKQIYDVDFVYDDSSHDDTSADEEEHDDVMSGSDIPRRRRGRTAVCVCPFPDWFEVTPGGGRDGQEVVHRCRKCGLSAPRSGQESARECRKKVNIMQIQTEDGAEEWEDRPASGAERCDTTAAARRAVHAGSVGGTLTRPVRAVQRDGVVNSLEFRRASIASSLSEISDGAIEQAWREKLANDATIRDVNVTIGSREQSDAPSLTIKSYGPTSQATDADADALKTSPSGKTRLQDNGDLRDSTETTSNKKSAKKLTFFQTPDGSSGEDPGNFVLASESSRSRPRGGGILRNKAPSIAEDLQPTRVTYSQQPEPEVPLDRVPKRAYEKALARAQVENHPQDYAMLCLRVTEPFKFSYFEPAVKVCPYCKEPAPGSKKTKASKKQPEGKDKKAKKERKKRPKKFNEMKHIFGSVNVYDYYPGGKYNLQQ